jgi:uncharacterized protein YciI
MRYLVVYSRGTAWRSIANLHNQPFMAEHAVYVQQHFDQGKVVMAGPFVDHSGGAIVIDVGSEEEAYQFVQNDPAVVNGIFNYDLNPWNDGMNRYEGKNPNFGEEYIKIKHKVLKELNII